MDFQDRLKEIREKQHAKYEAERIKKEREDKEREEKEKVELEKKLQEVRRLNDELEAKKTKAITVLFEIEENIDNLQENYTSENILYSLSIIESLIQCNIIFIMEQNKLKELQDVVMNLITVLNMLNENNNDKKDLNILKNIYDTMKNIFSIVDLDIQIELMDTTNDENYAKEFNKKLNNL